jgi:hypothetical protein
MNRHARACRGQPRLTYDACKKGVDGRDKPDKPGHDGRRYSTTTRVPIGVRR